MASHTHSLPARALPGINYEVSAAFIHTHQFEVVLTIARPSAEQIVSLPVWIPGSYLVREFSRNLQQLKASQKRAEVAISQLDKCTWQVHCAAGQALQLIYLVYAQDTSVRTAWLSHERAFFNSTSVCLRVHGQENSPHALAISNSGLAFDWQVATALTPLKINARGFGQYLAADYDELVDSPVEMGPFWSGSFSTGGIHHRLVVAGAPTSFDGARLLADTQAICEAEIAFWHGNSPKKAPHDRYLFLLNAVDNGYGGLEHRNCTALICKRADLPRLGQPKTLAANDGYTTLLGLISHEYFHTWNVKRLRPAEFASYDYTQENYTELLWFFEGFTSYYDDLLLHRTGLIDAASYLTLLGKTINAVLQTPGRQVQSVAQASFDAWIKYYRPDENTGNATISYYTKGALVALALDLSLRQSTAHSLDDVMRTLWQRCQGGPMTEADVLEVVTALGDQALATRLTQWVHGTADLPVKTLLNQQGVKNHPEPAALADQLGLRVTENAGIRVKSVHSNGAAETAGFAAGDEWLGIELGRAKTRQSWRLNKLDDLPLYLGGATCFTALVARDQRLQRLPVTLPNDVQQVKLVVRDASLANAWLSAKKSKTIALNA
ncbi:MAG: peptidase M61 [Comamonadaceae bacterium CG12_big_fil_rev_8_21_14_0_65_59_15]|nr:MAG: peptidase M61 [Comamonadaceae bacterium CG12_big_fil_rev_8_21_14_0_65_59_15]